MKNRVEKPASLKRHQLQGDTTVEELWMKVGSVFWSTQTLILERQYPPPRRIGLRHLLNMVRQSFEQVDHCLSLIQREMFKLESLREVEVALGVCNVKVLQTHPCPDFQDMTVGGLQAQIELELDALAAVISDRDYSKWGLVGARTVLFNACKLSLRVDRLLLEILIRQKQELKT